MAERSSTEYNSSDVYPNLRATLLDDEQFRLNKIIEVRDYFIGEIRERELMNKRLSKYIASFDKSLFVLSVTTDSVSIVSFAAVIGAVEGILSARFSLEFSISTGIVKKVLKTTRNKTKKHNKIVMLARSKLNRIESKISEALINNEINHEDFIVIINEEKQLSRIKRKY